MQSAKCKIADENGLFSVECEEWSMELNPSTAEAVPLPFQGSQDEVWRL